MVQATRYKVTREKVQVKGASAKPEYKSVTHKTPYVVTVRDDRLSPARAIPAAAIYLAGLNRNLAGAIGRYFAYHCGPGCVAEMQDLTRHSRGIPKDQVTVPRMFFSCSPAWNHELLRGHPSSRCSAISRPLIISA